MEPVPDGEEDATLKREQEAEDEARVAALQRVVQRAGALPAGAPPRREGTVAGRHPPPAPRVQPSRACPGGGASRLLIQRKTPRGGMLPAVADLVDARVESWVTKEKQRLAPAIEARSLADARAHVESLWASATRGSSVSGEITGTAAFLAQELEQPHEDLAAALAAVKEKITLAERTAGAQRTSARRGASAPVWAERAQVTEARKALDRFEEAARDYAARQVSARLGRLHAKQEQMRKEKPRASLGDAFVALRDGTGKGLEHGYVPRAAKAGFAAALLELPGVRFILGRKDTASGPGGPAGPMAHPTPTTKKARLTTRVPPEWRDGGRLDDRALRTVVDDAWARGRGEERLHNATLIRRLGKADTLIRHMTGREVLSTVARPHFEVHTRGAQSGTNLLGQRANCSNGIIKIGYDTPTNTIMHEVGHHLEHSLPPEVWHDIRVLVEKRHDEAGGGPARRGPVGPTMLGEGTYGGTYATGRYTATENASGGSEVFSMAMEYFASPTKARALIVADPLHAAIILRALDPAGYGKVAALRAYDRYLPYGGRSGLDADGDEAPVPVGTATEGPAPAAPRAARPAEERPTERTVS